MIKPEALYAGETLTLHKKGELENILKEERKIMRKILGPRHTEEGYHLQSRKSTEKLSNIAADLRKRRIRFYGHVKRLPNTRLTHQILERVDKLKNFPWTQQTKADMKKAQIQPEEISNRNIYRKKIDKWEVTPENEVPKRTGTKWTEERKRIFSEQMKASWILRKRHHHKASCVPKGTIHGK